jgi:tetratricopeptide (TPR) repeat protein
MPVPAQLPPDVSWFTGREPQLAELDALLTGRDGRVPTAVVVSAVSGAAGVGKTALAVHWAHRVAACFPSGQLYVNLRGFDSDTPMSPAEAVRYFLDALGVPAERVPTGLGAQVGLFRSLLAGRQMLVVLDNARSVDQVRALLPGTPGCLVLVTSRNQLHGLVAAEGAHPVMLDVLSEEEVRQLLANRIGIERVLAEPHAVNEIVARCARLPLAVSIVAARAAIRPHFPLDVLANELSATRGRLDAFVSEDPVTDVRAVFSWSYQALDAVARRLYRLLGLHAGPDISAPAAASLAGMPPHEVKPLLSELTRANLLTEHSPGRFGFHDLLRAHAAELTQSIDSDIERTAALRRVLDHYTHTARKANRLLYPERDAPAIMEAPQQRVSPENLADHAQALSWFTAEHQVLLAAIRQAAAAELHSYTWRLAWTVAIFLDRQGHWHDQVSTQHAALDATRRLPDRRGQATAHRLLGGAYRLLGRYDDACMHLHEAFGLFEQLGDITGQARSRHNLALVSERQGRYQEALEYAEQSHKWYRAAGHRAGEANVLNLVGWIHAQLGDYEQTITSCEQALGIHREIGDYHGEAATLDSLGYAHHHLGNHTEATTCYQHAVDLFREHGDRYWEADTLTHIGSTYKATGNIAKALTAWRRALGILEDLNHSDAEAVRARILETDPGAAVTANGHLNAR